MNNAEDLEKRVAALESKVAHVPSENRLCLICFSGDLDKVISSFILATGAAASGMKVTLFFTFWGVSALKKKKLPKVEKTFLQRMFAMMLPKRSEKLPLSQLNMGGIGAKLIRHIMKTEKVASLEEMMEAAEALDVEINVCEMTMGLLGIKKEEIMDYSNLKYCGVASFIDKASKGKMSMYI